LLEEAILAPGQPLRAAVVFAHPHPLHGGTMHTKAVFRGTKALASIGCTVLRFNFRGVGRSGGTFDNAVGELEDFRAALDFMAGLHPDADLWAAGFSFGAYVALTSGARDDRVSTLIGIAPALHMYDFSAVKQSAKPKYFVQGERDELCPLAAMQAFFAELPPPKELAIVAGANHLFHGQVDEVGSALMTLLGREKRP
jgi:alpha/beta superfamily hydrolase